MSITTMNRAAAAGYLRRAVNREERIKDIPIGGTTMNVRSADRSLADQNVAEAQRIQLDLIEPNTANPRENDLDAVEALADNIEEYGLLQPVAVNHLGSTFVLISGHRRWAAFHTLRDRAPEDPRWQAIPAVVCEAADDDTRYLMLLSGQLHMVGWTLAEEADALQRLVARGYNLARIGAALQKTEGWASRRLRVHADPVLGAHVRDGLLPVTVAEELLSVRDDVVRTDLAQRAVRDHWSQTAARIAARQARSSADGDDAPARDDDAVPGPSPAVAEVTPDRPPAEAAAERHQRVQAGLEEVARLAHALFDALWWASDGVPLPADVVSDLDQLARRLDAVLRAPECTKSRPAA